jgi:DNA-binding transcriptional LysR family regulator
LEIGVKLLERKARGIALTAGGRVFLDHARLALMQIEVACEAARGTNAPGLRMHLADRACAQIIKALQNCLTRGPETP